MAAATASVALVAISAASARATSSTASEGSDLVGQAHGQGFLRPDLPAAQDHLLGSLEPDQSRQALGASGAGDDPEEDLRLSDQGVLGQIAEVGAHGQLQAASQGIAVDRGDGRLLQGLEECDRLLEAPRAPLRDAGVEGGLEALDVGTGGEVGLPGDDDSPDRGIDQPAEGLLELQGHLLGEGVHRGPVEADQGHRAIDRDLNVIHGPRLGPGWPRA